MEALAIIRLTCRDDSVVRLFCPTCQWFRQMRKASRRRSLCMGLFSIFLLYGHERVRLNLIASRPVTLIFPAASERELTDRALYVEFEPGYFCKQIDVGSADGAATKAHIGRRQVERLDHAADILQDQRICD